MLSSAGQHSPDIGGLTVAFHTLNESSRRLEHAYRQLLARVHSPAEGHGVFLKCDLPDEPPTVDTWVPVYAGANWHERETAEMFGIVFTGHPHPVNLYLPGAFEGHPLRKDFPLLSRRVKPWPGIVDVEAMPGDDGDGTGTARGVAREHRDRPRAARLHRRAIL